ncbi:MAG: TldD/PmbA family protein [Candidatus Bathyarchaeota archaeon]|nr:MAG: TldD/PmbA family protein [Candidatus Bathyarchaeota archaeon]
MEQELFDLGAQIIQDGEKYGADHVEAYLVSRKKIIVQVEKGAIKTAEEKLDVGCAIRAIVDKKLGFSYASTRNRSDIQALTKEAITLAKVSLPDASLHGFPIHNGSYPDPGGLHDLELSQMSMEGAIDLILRAVDACRAVLRTRKVLISAGLNIDSMLTVITNSLGIDGAYQETLIDLSTDPTIKEENSQASSFEFQISRNLSGIDSEWIGETAAANTADLLNPKTIKGGELPVIFTPMAVEWLFGLGFAQAFNAEEVQMRRSYLSDFLHQPIAPEHLEINDNALLPSGNQSRPFDAEGYPSQNTEIVKKGLLEQFLHNSYTAYKAQVDNTGNASRNPSRGSAGSPYQNTPSIAPSNLVITPGKGTLEDLIAETGKGILCRCTFDEPNLSTGDFSALVMEGFFVDKGEIQHPVKNTLIGINMRDFFLGVSSVGADTRSLRRVVSPSIVVESAKITSG